jgi:hypothetical protein
MGSFRLGAHGDQNPCGHSAVLVREVVMRKGVLYLLPEQHTQLHPREINTFPARLGS